MKEKFENNSKFKKILKRILAIFGVSTMVALPTIAATTKNKEEDKTKTNKEMTEFREELRVDTQTVEGELNKLLDQSYTKTQYSNFSYDQLLSEFNKIMEKKGFDGSSYELLKNVLDDLYKNYNGWKDVIPNMPNRETYIMEHVINAIDKVNSITIYDASDTRAQELLNENNTRYAFSDSDGNITIIYDKNKKENAKQMMAHELAHCNSESLYSDNYYIYYGDLKQVFTEGEATVAMKLLEDKNKEKLVIESIFNDKKILEYKLDNEEGYALEMNLYFNMLQLVGYKTMEDISLEKIELKQFKDIIEKKYGKESADKIFENLKIIGNSKQQGEEKREFNAGVALQKEFLNCMKKDIEKIKTKEEFDKFLMRYNYYEEFNMVCVKDFSQDDVAKDITYEYFQLNDIENILKESEQKINNQEVGETR